MRGQRSRARVCVIGQKLGIRRRVAFATAYIQSVVVLPQVINAARDFLSRVGRFLNVLMKCNVIRFHMEARPRCVLCPLGRRDWQNP